MEYDDRSPEDIEWASCMLEEAIGAGNIGNVRHYLPLADPASFPKGLWVAAMWGFTEAVEELIQLCDPKSDNSWALQMAAREGHISCVRVLIPVSDPKDNTHALINALYNDHMDIAEVLWPLSNMHDALSNLRNKKTPNPSVQRGVGFLEERIARQQRELLHSEVAAGGSVKSRKL